MGALRGSRHDSLVLVKCLGLWLCLWCVYCVCVVVCCCCCYSYSCALIFMASDKIVQLRFLC